MSVLSKCMCSSACLVLLGVRRGIGSPGTGALENCESPCGAGKWGPGLRQEQQVLFITEPSLQPRYSSGVILTVLELRTKEIWPRFKMFMLKPEIIGLGKAKNQSRAPKGQGKVS